MWRVAPPVTIAAVLWTGAALALPAARVTLEWTNEDASCMDASTLAATVERTLGRAAFHGDAPVRATILGSARSVAGGYSAEISLVAADGTKLSERSVTTDGDCQRLDESIAVVISLMIDSLEEQAGPLVVPTRPPRAPAILPTPETTAPAAAAPHPSATTALGFGGGVSSGVLPTIAPFVAMRAEVEPTAFMPIALTVRAYTPSDARVGGAGGEFYALSGELALCPTAKAGRLVRLGVCVGAGAGAVHGSPLDLLGGHSSDAPIVFALAAPSAALRAAGPLWLRIEVGLSVLLLQESWGFLGGNGDYVQVYHPGIIAPFASLGAELRVDP
jgi:hypothetical protein